MELFQRTFGALQNLTNETKDLSSETKDPSNETKNISGEAKKSQLIINLGKVSIPIGDIKQIKKFSLPKYYFLKTHYIKLTCENGLTYTLKCDNEVEAETIC